MERERLFYAVNSEEAGFLPHHTDEVLTKGHSATTVDLGKVKEGLALIPYMNPIYREDAEQHLLRHAEAAGLSPTEINLEESGEESVLDRARRISHDFNKQMQDSEDYYYWAYVEDIFEDYVVSRGRENRWLKYGYQEVGGVFVFGEPTTVIRQYVDAEISDDDNDFEEQLSRLVKEMQEVIKIEQMRPDVDNPTWYVEGGGSTTGTPGHYTLFIPNTTSSPTTVVTPTTSDMVIESNS